MFSRWLVMLARPSRLPPRSLQPCPPLRGSSRGPPGGSSRQPPALTYGAAFRLKPLPEILRSLLVFKLCSYPALVGNSEKLMNVARRMMGKWLFTRVMKWTIYGQFVAGEKNQEIQQSLRKLSKLGIRPMLAVPMEEDIGTQKSEHWYENNLRTMLKCVDLSLGSNYRSMMQLKVTALMGADLCKKLTLAHTQSSGAEDLGVHRVMEVMDGQDLTFPSLTDLETQHLWASLRRLNDIGQYAKQNGVRLLVDAEYTYLNPALSLVTMALMGRFNVSEPAIWNTYQCYLKHCDARLSADVEWASSRGLCFGVKLVRGAYMEKERELAKRLGYPDPIQASWEDTNSNYQKLLDKMLELVREKRQKFSLVIATHNETSVTHALRRMGELGIGCDNESLCFGQLLGMCDHISLTLGSAGYSVYKSIPYGTVEEVMPYLMRRAQENLSIIQGLRTERELLWQEVRRRLFSRTGHHSERK